MKLEKIYYIIDIFMLIGNLLGREVVQKTQRYKEVLFLVIFLYLED
jgi:hypothetical protein